MLNAQQNQKQLEKEIKDKAIREARKESKSLKKSGWYVAPGSLPLDKLIENAWMKQYMVDEQGNARFITADGNAVAESKSVADMQSIELAKLQLAGLIQTNISSLVDANIGNAQLSTTDAASVTEIVQSAKNVIAQELGYVNPFFKIYRDLPDDKIEAQVRLFYDVKQSLEIAKKVVRKELKEKLEMNSQQLDKLMGL
ncbi:MAG TPA: hypothetical protein DDX98_11750 [Bacteroidales bacterium]|nr:hypothetical protein [Bacteroidales bacterium]